MRQGLNNFHRFLSVTRMLLFGTALALFCWHIAPAATENCAALVNARCVRCHYLTRVCDKVADNKGKWSWKRTVRNMVRLGAKIDETEQDKLVDCLSGPAPDVQQLCAKQ